MRKKILTILLALSLLIVVLVPAPRVHSQADLGQFLPLKCASYIAPDSRAYILNEASRIYDSDAESVTAIFDLGQVPQSQWGNFGDSGGRPSVLTYPAAILSSEATSVSIVDTNLYIPFNGLAENLQKNGRYTFTTHKVVSSVPPNSPPRLYTTMNPGGHQIFFRIYPGGLNIFQYLDLCPPISYEIKDVLDAEVEILAVASDGVTQVPPDTLAYWNVTIKNVKLHMSGLAEGDRSFNVYLDTQLLPGTVTQVMGNLGPINHYTNTIGGKVIRFVLKPVSFAGTHKIILNSQTPGFLSMRKFIEKQFTVYPEGTAPTATPAPTRSPTCDICHTQGDICTGQCSSCSWCASHGPTPITLPHPDTETLCKNTMADTKLAANLQNCIDCAKGQGKYAPNPGLWTAIGCIPLTFEDIINKYLFTTGIGIVGGIAFLYLIYGCILILTSAGNPEQIAQAREIITSSIMGLLLAIFSVFILRILTVDILKLPDFGPTPTPPR